MDSMHSVKKQEQKSLSRPSYFVPGLPLGSAPAPQQGVQRMPVYEWLLGSVGNLLRPR